MSADFIFYDLLLNPCGENTTTCAVFPDRDSIDAAGGRTYLLVWQVKQKFPVKASGPPECRVDRVESVCSTNDHYLPTTVQAVHQGQQGGHNRTGWGKEGRHYCVIYMLHLHIVKFQVPNIESWRQHRICPYKGTAMQLGHRNKNTCRQFNGPIPITNSAESPKETELF